MDLAFFNFVSKKISENRKLKAINWPIVIYRYFDKNWYNGTSLINQADGVIASLAAAREKDRYKNKNSKSYFYIKVIDSVVEVNIPARTRQLNVDEFEAELNDVVINAEFHFNATHDKLTRLLNRAGFESELDKLKISDDTHSGSEENEISSSQNYVALATLDIDHFKQINDSYSHQYGDVVLKAFAWRIDDFAKTIRKKYRVRCLIGRVGGEEFDLLLVDLKEKELAGKIFDEFRLNIAGDRIPSKDQWAPIKEEINYQGDLPPESEREVKSSIGYAVVEFYEKPDLKKVYEKLKGRADAALYRAKANGRNCVIDFDDIRKKHGRVLNHYNDTGVVLIDIGAKVGVKIGAVYSVFLPNFVGGEELFQEDGRTKKKIGTLPHVCSGRISVIEVQDEISFCQVVSQSKNIQFSERSKIEYVPMGIVRPLPISNSPSPIPTILTLEDFHSLFSRVVTDQLWQSLFIFRLRQKKYNEGKSKVSGRLLTRSDRKEWAESLSNLIRVAIPKSIIGFLRDDLIVMYHNEGADNKRDMQLALDMASELELYGFTCCGFIERTLGDENSLDITRSRNELSADELIYCARVSAFVASDADRKNSESGVCERFSIHTARKVLYRLRRSGNLENIIIDYHKLCKIGCDTDAFHNQLAVAIIENRDIGRLNFAEKALERALQISQVPKNNSGIEEVIKSNLMVTKVYHKKYFEAYTLVWDIDTKFIQDENIDWLYSLALFKCIKELEADKGKEPIKTGLKRHGGIRNLIKIKDILITVLKNRHEPAVGFESEWYKEFKYYVKKS